jgi:hypothetical protein
MDEESNRSPITILVPGWAMGFTQTPNAILRASDLSWGAKGVYGLLLSYAWGEGRSFPGQEKLAADGGCSLPSIRSYLKELESAALLRIKRRGQGKTNEYILLDHPMFHARP